MLKSSSRTLYQEDYSIRLYVLVALLLLGLDLLSKSLTVSHLTLIQFSSASYPWGGVGLFRDVLGIDAALAYTTNKGAAWGMLAGYQLPLLIFRLVALLVLTYLFVKRPHVLGSRWPWLLIIVGALGNVVDTFLYGHVIDMIKVVLWGYHFPVFNVADSCITVGMACVLALSVFPKVQQAR